MLTARQSSELLSSMSAEERLQALNHKVKSKTKQALEKKIRESVAAYERDIELTLKANVCTDEDEDIEALLKALGYNNVKVTSDFPGYNESYKGTTTIKFTIPF